MGFFFRLRGGGRLQDFGLRGGGGDCRVSDGRPTRASFFHTITVCITTSITLANHMVFTFDRFNCQAMSIKVTFCGRKVLVVIALKIFYIQALKFSVLSSSVFSKKSSVAINIFKSFILKCSELICLFTIPVCDDL